MSLSKTLKNAMEMAKQTKSTPTHTPYDPMAAMQKHKIKTQQYGAVGTPTGAIKAVGSR